MTDVTDAESILDGAKLDYRITQISLVVRDLRKTMEQYHALLGGDPGMSSSTFRRCTTTLAWTVSLFITRSSARRPTSAATRPG